MRLSGYYILRASRLETSEGVNFTQVVYNRIGYLLYHRVKREV